MLASSAWTARKCRIDMDAVPVDGGPESVLRLFHRLLQPCTLINPVQARMAADALTSVLGSASPE